MNKIILLAYLLGFPLLTLGQLPAPELSCRISSDKEVYKVGETPLIVIHIINNADSTIQLVKALDGSESNMRFPYLYYEVYRISGSTSSRLSRPLMSRCGNMDGIKAGDFVTVEPGQIFDPLANQDYVYTGDITLDGWIHKKGHYKIIFHYSTNQSDFKQWRGDLGNWSLDKESRQAIDKKLLTLFAKVPKADLVSNELFIDFR